MAKLSAGTLVFKVTPERIVEVLLVHPGGPFWASRDAGAWSVPKGEYEDGDDPSLAAEREFAEELGAPAPAGPRLDLGTVKQTGGKHVRAWALEGEFEASSVSSNTFETEWPRGSGRTASFPEIDRAAWFSVAEARGKLVKGQVTFLERLMASLAELGREGIGPG